MTSSYIVQRSHNFVISMAPSEQSKFIETLAFDDDIHKEYKLKFKEKVKEYKTQHSKLVVCTEMLERELLAKENSLPKNSNIDGNSSPEEYEDISVEEIKSKQLVIKKKLSSYENKISVLTEELKNLEDNEIKSSALKESLKTLEIEVNHLTSQRSKLGKVKSLKEIEKIEAALEKAKDTLQHTQSYLKYKLTIDKAEKFRDEYREDLKGKITDLSSNLPSEEKRSKLYEDIKNREVQRKAYEKENLQIQKEKIEKDNAAEILKKINSDTKEEFPGSYGKLNKKEKALLTLLEKRKVHNLELEQKCKKIIEELKEKKICGEIYECPSCKKNLHFHKGGLKLSRISKGDSTKGDSTNGKSGENIAEILEEKEKNLLCCTDTKNNINMWISQLKDITPILGRKITKSTVKYDYDENLKDEKIAGEYQRLEKEISDLEELLKSNKLSSVIESLFKEAKVLSKNFPKEFRGESSNLEKLEKEVSVLSSTLEEAWRVKSGWSTITREINTRKRKIESMEHKLKEKKFLLPSGEARDSKKVQDEISLIQKNVVKYSTESAELQETFIIVSEYENYKRSLQEIENLKNEKKQKIIEASHVEKKLEGAMGLEEAGREAEILAMKATIDSINEHAKFYLEKMFVDPVEVYLQGHKTTSKGDYRTQLNTIVNYRGDESCIDDLSGGEAQRCELAFLLAVNDMMGSPMILLDECLNNLDAEVNMETILHLRELAEDKLIFVSSHEAVKGTFDKVIEL